MTIVDAHLHLWDPDVLRYDWLEGALLRRFGPEDLAEAEGRVESDGGGVERIFVQADCDPSQSLDEVEWVESHAEATDIVGIVAHAPLEHGPSAVGDLLERYAERDSVVGVRRLLQSEPPGFAGAPGFRSAVRMLADLDLVFDACVRPSQLADVIALADAAPGLSIVLDHLGKPVIDGGPDPAWRSAIAALAERPSVTVKLSGLPAEIGAGWTSTQVEPFLDVCLDAFGPDRLIYGGDWPVSQPLALWRDTVSRWSADRLGATGSRAVMGGNARRVYGIRS